MDVITKITWTGWFKQLFITVLETGKSKITVLADSVSGDSVLPGSQKVMFLLCFHMV